MDTDFKKTIKDIMVSKNVKFFDNDTKILLHTNEQQKHSIDDFFAKLKDWSIDFGINIIELFNVKIIMTDISVLVLNNNGKVEYIQNDVYYSDNNRNTKEKIEYTYTSEDCSVISKIELNSTIWGFKNHYHLIDKDKRLYLEYEEGISENTLVIFDEFMFEKKELS